jgi:hypothetical protein
VVEEITLVQRDAVSEMLDPVELLGRGTADHAVDLIALLEQQLGEVRTVLASDPSDEGGL